MKYLLYHNAIKKTYGVKNKIQYNTIVNFVKTKLQHSTLTSRSFIRCFFINNLNCWTLGARRGEGCLIKGSLERAVPPRPSNHACLRQKLLISLPCLREELLFSIPDLFCFEYRIEQIFQTNIVEIDI